MGEKIKDLSKFMINDKEICIELNDSYSKGVTEYDIHIQSDVFQYSLSDVDFMKLVSAVATAKHKIETFKNSNGV